MMSILATKQKMRKMSGEKSVYNQLNKITDVNNDTFIILGGKDYIIPLQRYLTNIECPLKGRIGEQNKFLKLKWKKEKSSGNRINKKIIRIW
ncbi:MAG: hypothetical protein LBC92_02300 [Rickettsiales bacterium]|jgi:hypothetical protein|nr:hypothetical protein [Rickettsiales bacterium]